MAEHGHAEPQVSERAQQDRAPDPDGAPTPLAAAPAGPALILALQRSAGNAGVARMLQPRPEAAGRLQRGFRIFGVSVGEDEQLTVQEVIDRQDADLIDNLPRARLLGASREQKLQLLQLLANQWAGDEDERLMEAIWGSFDDPIAVADDNMSLWELCVARGADLDELQAVQDARTEYEQDVKAVARNYLAENRRHVRQELDRLGIASGDGPPRATTEEQRAEVEELQRVATELHRAQQVREELKEQVVVGYDLVPEARPGLIGSATTTPQEHAEDVVARRGRRMLQPTTFDPFRPPHHLPFGDEQPPMASYERVKAYDDELARYIAGFAARYPAMYALIREGRVGEVGAEGTTPEQAQAIVAQVLQGTLAKIDETEPKLATNDLDWRDLTPIHLQLREGSAAGAHRWDRPFRRWVAEDLLEGHRARQFWVQLGLGSLAAAAFVVASLATAGTATFFIAAGIGVGISAGQAAYAWENYEDLQTAVDTSMSRETEMVTQGQASAEMIRATVETVLAFLAAVGFGARAIRAAGGAAAAAGGGEAALVAAARGRISARIAYMERRIGEALTRRGARSTVATTAREELEQIHQGALRDAAAIRNGRLPEFADLPPATRNQLADEYVEQVGRTWRDAQQRVARAAEAAEAPRVVPPDPAAAPGSPSVGFGHPPARRPPSTHSGTGWEDW